MIAPTPDTTAHLMWIKHTYQLASGFARRNDPPNRVIATIMMDYVAESVLKTVYWYHPNVTQRARDIRFPDLLEAVAALSGSPAALPLQAQIGSLHDQRNLTQHRDVTPSAEDVSKNAAYVEAFMRDMFDRFFGVDLDALTMASLVNDRELRKHLRQAEKLLREGRVRDAVEESTIALDKALRRATDVVGVEAYPFLSDFTVRTDAERAGFTREQVEVLQDLGGQVQQLRLEVAERLLIVAVGLDYAAHARFKTIAPRVWWNINQKVNVNHTKEAYSPDEAKEILDYSLNQIVRLEAMGALVAPKGEP